MAMAVINHNEGINLIGTRMTLLLDIQKIGKQISGLGNVLSLELKA